MGVTLVSAHHNDRLLPVDLGALTFESFLSGPQFAAQHCVRHQIFDT